MRRLGAFDNIGFGLLMAWTGSVQIVLDKGQEDDWFGRGVGALGSGGVSGLCLGGGFGVRGRIRAGWSTLHVREKSLL